jgi:Protein of unknown function (DUF1826)/CobW/HypB/UreG, nucleotide-binding domain
MRSRQTTGAVNSLDLRPFNRGRHRDDGDAARRRAPRRAPCTDARHFHVYHATVRLVCTYAGPTSEWLEERDVDRSSSPGPPGLHRRSLHRDPAVRRCAPLDVVLFKGTA